MSYSRNVKTIIKIVGIGGAGCNAINNITETVGDKIRSYMSKDGTDYSIIAMNTDRQSLDHINADLKLQLGCDGRGAGSNPDAGREAAQYSSEDIKQALDGATLIIIFTGLGGGTGSGSTSEVAKIAKEMGILVIVIATKPFSFEGKFRMNIALKAIEELKKSADLTVILSNDSLYTVTSNNTSFIDAFRYMDEFVKSVVVAIIDALMQTGLVNVDFADMRMIIEDKGMGVLGIGESEGEDAAKKAVELALSNPILEQKELNGATGAMVYIAGTKNICLSDVNTIVSSVYEKLNNDDAKVIYGSTLCDNALGDDVFIKDVNSTEKRIKVLLIVTGLNNDQNINNNNKNTYRDDIKSIFKTLDSNLEKDNNILEININKSNNDNKNDNISFNSKNNKSIKISNNSDGKNTGFFASISKLFSWL
mgnify:CR=1 FL=1